MISILDYGAGNLKSVVNAFRFIGAEVEITHDAGRLMQAQAAVLPGRFVWGRRGFSAAIRALAAGAGFHRGRPAVFGHLPWHAAAL